MLYQKLSQRGPCNWRELRSSRSTVRNRLKEFVELPYRLYRDDPYWVPPLRIAVKELLDRRKHPLLRQRRSGAVSWRSRNGATVGRIAAIIDKAHNRVSRRECRFLRFLRDRERSRGGAGAAGRRARRWVFDRGAEFIRGPVNPSTNYECGMLVDGFDSSPMVMMTYNPRYYPAVDGPGGPAQGQGPAGLPEQRQHDRPGEDRAAWPDRVLANSGVRVRPINMKDFAAKWHAVWEVYYNRPGAGIGVSFPCRAKSSSRWARR